MNWSDYPPPTKCPNCGLTYTLGAFTTNPPLFVVYCDGCHREAEVRVVDHGPVRAWEEVAVRSFGRGESKA